MKCVTEDGKRAAKIKPKGIPLVLSKLYLLIFGNAALSSSLPNLLVGHLSRSLAMEEYPPMLQRSKTASRTLSQRVKKRIITIIVIIITLCLLSFGISVGF